VPKAKGSGVRPVPYYRSGGGVVFPAIRRVESCREERVLRTLKVDWRLVHEETSKRGGDNVFSLVLGERFVVSASGVGVELKELKAVRIQ
jgi:hypothetical protein